MRKKEREEWMKREEKLMDLLTSERYAHRLEVKELLNRIQHPQIFQPPAPEEPIVSEPPQDFAELAHVGGTVPDFVSVGSADQILREDKEIARVGTIEET